MVGELVSPNRGIAQCSLRRSASEPVITKYCGARQVLDLFDSIPVWVIVVPMDSIQELSRFTSLRADNSVDNVFLYSPLNLLVGSSTQGAFPRQRVFVTLSRGHHSVIGLGLTDFRAELGCESVSDLELFCVLPRCAPSRVCSPLSG